MGRKYNLSLTTNKYQAGKQDSQYASKGVHLNQTGKAYSKLQSYRPSFAKLSPYCHKAVNRLLSNCYGAVNKLLTNYQTAVTNNSQN